MPMNFKGDIIWKKIEWGVKYWPRNRMNSFPILFFGYKKNFSHNGEN